MADVTRVVPETNPPRGRWMAAGPWLAAAAATAVALHYVVTYLVSPTEFRRAFISSAMVRTMVVPLPARWWRPLAWVEARCRGRMMIINEHDGTFAYDVDRRG